MAEPILKEIELRLQNLFSIKYNFSGEEDEETNRVQLLGSLLEIYDDAWKLEGLQSLVGSDKPAMRKEKDPANIGMSPVSSRSVDPQTRPKLKKAALKIKRNLLRIELGHLLPSDPCQLLPNDSKKFARIVTAIMDKCEQRHRGDGLAKKVRLIVTKNLRPQQTRMKIGGRDNNARHEIDNEQKEDENTNQLPDSCKSIGQEQFADVSMVSAVNGIPVGRQLPRTPPLKQVDENASASANKPQASAKNIIPTGAQLLRTPFPSKDLDSVSLEGGSVKRRTSENEPPTPASSQPTKTIRSKEKRVSSFFNLTNQSVNVSNQSYQQNEIAEKEVPNAIPKGSGLPRTPFYKEFVGTEAKAVVNVIPTGSQLARTPYIPTDKLTRFDFSVQDQSGNEGESNLNSVEPPNKAVSEFTSCDIDEKDVGSSTILSASEEPQRSTDGIKKEDSQRKQETRGPKSMEDATDPPTVPEASGKPRRNKNRAQNGSDQEQEKVSSSKKMPRSTRKVETDPPAVPEASGRPRRNLKNIQNTSELAEEKGSSTQKKARATRKAETDPSTVPEPSGRPRRNHKNVQSASELVEEKGSSTQKKPRATKKTVLQDPNIAAVEEINWKPTIKVAGLKASRWDQREQIESLVEAKNGGRQNEDVVENVLKNPTRLALKDKRNKSVGEPDNVEKVVKKVAESEAFVPKKKIRASCHEANSSHAPASDGGSFGENQNQRRTRKTSKTSAGCNPNVSSSGDLNSNVTTRRGRRPRKLSVMEEVEPLPKAMMTTQPAEKIPDDVYQTPPRPTLATGSKAILRGRPAKVLAGKEPTKLKRKLKDEVVLSQTSCDTSESVLRLVETSDDFYQTPKVEDKKKKTRIVNKKKSVVN